MGTPCEQYQWTMLPAIRRELTMCLVENFELSQAEIAKKLNLSRAAVCQYINGKRGNEGLDKELQYEIAYSAAQIFENGKSVAQIEVCRLCKIIRDNKKK